MVVPICIQSKHHAKIRGKQSKYNYDVIGGYMEQPKVNDNLVVNIPKPIQWVIPESVRTDHATHLIVQQQGSEFMLFFFEVATPFFTGTQEEQIAAYKDIPALHAKCVAKVVMSVENVGQAANSLVEALNNFNSVLQATSTKGQKNAGTPEHTEPSTIN